MERAMRAGWSLVLLVALLLASAGRAAGSDVTGYDNACLIDWSQAELADAFELVELSERCWGVGMGQPATELYLLAKLRLETDLSFLEHEPNADEALDLFQLSARLSALDDHVRSQMPDQPEAVVFAMERIIHFTPVLPPAYLTRFHLQSDAETYSQEFEFQRAARVAEMQPAVELAQDPEWRDALKQLGALLEDESDSQSEASEAIEALGHRVQELWSEAARTVAERASSDAIVILIRSYGIYRPEGEPVISEGKETPLGLFLNFDDFIHVETTDSIPVRWNESFGLEVELAGVPVNVPIRLEWSMHHGPLPGSDGHPSSHSRERLVKQSSNGTLSLSKFLTFVEGVPVACGPWLIELLYRDEMLLSKTFFVHGCD